MSEIENRGNPEEPKISERPGFILITYFDNVDKSMKHLWFKENKMDKFASDVFFIKQEHFEEIKNKVETFIPNFFKDNKKFDDPVFFAKKVAAAIGRTDRYNSAFIELLSSGFLSEEGEILNLNKELFNLILRYSEIGKGFKFKGVSEDKGAEADEEGLDKDMENFSKEVQAKFDEYGYVGDFNVVYDVDTKKFILSFEFAGIKKPEKRIISNTDTNKILDYLENFLYGKDIEENKLFKS